MSPSNLICRRPLDAVDFWRASPEFEAVESAGRESFWLLTLDPERRIAGCVQIKSKSFGDVARFADEALADSGLRDAGELILLHYRPGVPPVAGAEDKSRVRAVVRAAEGRKVTLLDFIICGDKSATFPDGFFAFHKDRCFRTTSKISQKMKR